MISKFGLQSFYFIGLCIISLNLMAGNGEPAVLTYTFDACESNTANQSGMDYSEFLPFAGSNGPVRLTSVGSAYREKPFLNRHSCTEGLNGTPAICLSFDPFCNYLPGSAAAMRFIVNLNPTGIDPVRLESLSFQQKAPDVFSWVNGVSGVNNYPTLYAVRILKNGVVILDERDIPTTRDWALSSYAFENNPDFVVTTPTDFVVELTAYCPVGNIGNQSIWDLEDVTFTANCDGECTPFSDGGSISLTDGSNVYNGCLGNTVIELFSTTTAAAEDYYYIVTDENLIIQEVFSTSTLDLSNYQSGTYRVFGYGDIGNGPMDSYIGRHLNEVPADVCSSFSINSVTVDINNPMGGLLTGGPFEICVGDGSSDILSSGAINLTGNNGANTQWVITGPDGDVIIALPELLDEFDLDNLAPGTCMLMNLSYDGWLKGLIIGGRLSDLRGTPNATSLLPIPPCYSLSNPITIVKRSIQAGTLAGGPFTFCVGDGVPDILTVSEVGLNHGTGDHNMWVVTDAQGLTVLQIENNLSDINFENNPRGTCLLWSLSYNQTLTGLGVGADFTSLPDCVVKSNYITVNRLFNTGGTISNTLPLEFCVGDGIPDFIPAGSITLVDNEGANSQWIITDANGIIINAPLNSYADLDLDRSEPGTCYVTHMSYDGPLMGLAMGSSIDDITGCHMLSNSLPLMKVDCIPLEGGLLNGGPFSLCTGDGNADILSGVSISGTTGTINQLVVTDVAGMILDQISDINTYDFENTGAGDCLLWNVTYEPGLIGLMDGNNIFNDLDGKHDLSNSIAISKNQPVAGTLEGGPFTFCVGDGTEDRIAADDLTHTGSTSQSGIWLITDENEQAILGVGNQFNEINFDDYEGGSCRLIYIAYEGPISGIQIGQTVGGLSGCFSRSNAVTISKNKVAGGILDNGSGSVAFCIGDGIADYIPAGSISLSGNIGDTETWVITNTAGTEILGIPNSPYDVNFDLTGPGTCVLWSVSSIGPINGLELGGDFALLEGCAARSNFITIFRYQNTGGTITSPEIKFCVGDGIADYIPSNSVTLAGNTGVNSQWLIVDPNGIILNAPLNSYDEVDFEDSPAGSCQLYHMSYDGPLSGLAGGLPFSDLDGCFTLSNAIPIIKEDCPTLIDDIVLTHISDGETVELRNTGSIDIELENLWLCNYPEFTEIEIFSTECDESLTLEAGESILIKSGFDIRPESGELALFYENDAGNKIIKGYVQWGESNHHSAGLAVDAGLWSQGTYVPAFSPGMGISFEGPVMTASSWTETESIHCQSTSTTEIKNNEYSIFPNPVKNKLHISSTLHRENVEFQLIDNQGKIWTNEKSSSGKVEMELASVPAGIYFLQINDGVTRIAKKIIKL